MLTSRRDFLASNMSAAAMLAVGRTAAGNVAPAPQIERQGLVRRHNPLVRQIDPYAALSVGNGQFAFTADVTGLQTFLEPYGKEFPLCTAAHWGWHTAPLPAGLRVEEIRYKQYEVHGRSVGYLTDVKGQETLANWLRQNPHRLHLGRIGFAMQKSDGSTALAKDLTNIRQVLDLWTGILDSRFDLEGKPVHVHTCCHPDLDLVAVRVESPLLADNRLQVLLAFPYGSPNVDMADWAAPGRHRTECRQQGRRADFHRTVDNDAYKVTLAWSAGELKPSGPHEYLLSGVAANLLEAVCDFSKAGLAVPLPSLAQTEAASAAHWGRFWTEGGVIDLGNCTDRRAGELERRIVLSQYNTALHCSGSLPSAETGLLFNSWYGKFHLEMHWWHSVHFTAWRRFPLFERGMDYYRQILPVARENARRQGYRGARWPKMVGPDGRDSPSPVGPLLIWQQPHPIYYAELSYRHRPTRQTLDHWREIVFESADFMASYALLDVQQGRYVLGPPLKTVSENTDPLTTINPTFELTYWRFGLQTAQTWRTRLGLPREPKWDDVLKRLSPLAQESGLYLMQEGMRDTYSRWNWEHPAVLGACGMLPGTGVDAGVMRATVRKVMEVWQWPRCWGWDFPLAAMACARAGEPELAIQALLVDVPKNRYHPNGHNYQRPGLTAYLPGNGGLLAAVAMMAAGWEGGPATAAPGFPAGGKWAVRWENLERWM
jgi:protein-glucosylgalactosylhydroxylysine glucosidase